MAPAGSKASGRGPDRPQDIFIEFVVQGRVAKATAIHAGSGVEASVVGPATAPRATLADAAVRKLTYLMKKQSEG